MAFPKRQESICTVSKQSNIMYLFTGIFKQKFSKLTLKLKTLKEKMQKQSLMTC